MDGRIYRSVVAPFLESRTTRHYNVPCHNLLCLEKLIQGTKNSHTENSEIDNDVDRINLDTFPFYERFKYETESCTVLYPGWSITDLARDYVFRKLFWYKKLRRYMPKELNKSMRQLKQEKLFDAQKIDRKLFKFLQWLSFEEDDKFVGKYNWLYTGGNIAGFKYNNEYWLITPDEFKQFTNLCITKLSANLSPLWKSNDRPMRISLCHSEPVYQITCKPKTDNVFLAVRHKDWISIKKLYNNDCEIMDVWDVKTFKKSSCNNYLTTSDLSQDCKYVCLVSNGADMAVLNVEVEMPIFSWRQEGNFMKWTKLLFNNVANQVYLADPHSFKIFDLRAQNEQLIYRPTAVANKCENICNFLGSESRENILYITTCHSIIEVDIRTGKNLQKWTHMMERAPQFGGTSRREDEELIILQSYNSSELIGINNEGLYDEFGCSKSSPYLFSSVKDELRKAHLNGLGLHEKISERLDFHVTGLHVATCSQGTVAVFTVNGGGDVVMTKLKDGGRPDATQKDTREWYIERESGNSFKKLEMRCSHLQTERKRRYASGSLSFIDITALLPVFKKVKTEGRRRRKRCKRIYNYWESSEMYSPENLSYCEGGFYDRFLPYWGIKLKSVEDDEEKDEKEDEKVEESRAKVEGWMNLR